MRWVGGWLSVCHFSSSWFCSSPPLAPMVSWDELATYVVGGRYFWRTHFKLYHLSLYTTCPKQPEPLATHPRCQCLPLPSEMKRKPTFSSESFLCALYCFLWCSFPQLEIASNHIPTTTVSFISTKFHSQHWTTGVHMLSGLLLLGAFYICRPQILQYSSIL